MAEAFTALLDGREVDVRLDAAIVSTTYDLSIESTLAVTMVVHDQRRQLRRSGILDRDKDGKLDAAIELELDGIPYRLASVRKAADVFTLGFEDRVVARLRSARGPLKPKGPGGDHVAFAKMLVRRSGVPFVTPTGIAVVESGGALDEKRQRSDADDRRERGMPASRASTSTRSTGGGPSGTGPDPATDNDDAPTEVRAISADDLTVQGKKATPDQLRNMEVVMGVATARDASKKATLALLEACIVESLFLNLRHGDRDSEGILQVRIGIHGAAVARSVSKSCTEFLTTGFTGRGGAIDLAAAHADWDAGQVAQAVQGSAHPGRYSKWRKEGLAIIDAYGGLDAIGGEDGGSSRAGTLIQRGTAEDPNEDSWAALGRIGQAKGYRAFAYRGRVYYAREQDLVKSRARAIITEGDPGVDYIDWEVSPRKRVNTATVECRASLWAVPPGAAVIVKDEGVADGRWLVASFRRTRDSQKATVELRRGTELLRPEATLEAGGASGSGGVGGAGGSVYDAAQTISDQNRAYLYGGGHGVALRTLTGREPLDCSSSTCLALLMAGVYKGPNAIVSGQLASTFGTPGRGEYFTVMANGGHCFIVFHGEHEGWRFDTSSRTSDSNRESGPRLRKGKRDTGGFTARSIKGG